MSDYFKSWETDTKYYEASIYQDLFGCWIIDKCWCGKKNNRHGGHVESCNNMEDAFLKMGYLDKVRKRRGYRNAD
jgi:hypothetical protein